MENLYGVSPQGLDAQLRSDFLDSGTSTSALKLLTLKPVTNQLAKS